MRRPLAMGRKWCVVTGSALLLLAGQTAAWAQNTFPASGNVGIGTTSPSLPLDLHQSTDEPLGGFRLLNSAGERALYLWVDSASVARLDAARDGWGRLAINSGGGNVGIGTANPLAQFDLRQTTDAPLGGLRLLNSAGEQAVYLWVDAGNVARLDAARDGGASLAINAGGGRVGIGTATPLTKLDVRQDTDSSIGGLRLLNAAAERSALLWVDSSNIVRLDSGGGGTGSLAINSGGGWVGIGTTAPSYPLHVQGDAYVSGNIAAKYQDIAEWVRTGERLPGGAVVVIDETQPNQVVLASRPYDTRVAGVVSERPGVLLGEAAADKAKVAHSGRVKVKVDARYGAVAIGDLLVTSPTAGHAMRSTPVDLAGTPVHRPGTLLGKALEPLGEGQGEILVLLMLQ